MLNEKAGYYFTAYWLLAAVQPAVTVADALHEYRP